MVEKELLLYILTAGILHVKNWRSQKCLMVKDTYDKILYLIVMTVLTHLYENKREMTEIGHL